MGICPRCGRGHSGICGIPAGVTLRFGARIGGVQRPAGGGSEIHGKPQISRPSTEVLERLLAQGKAHLVQVMEMLKVVPAAMPEYTELLDREGKLVQLIKQVEGQIAARRGAK